MSRYNRTRSFRVENSSLIINRSSLVAFYFYFTSSSTSQCRKLWRISSEMRKFLPASFKNQRERKNEWKKGYSSRWQKVSTSLLFPARILKVANFDEYHRKWENFYLLLLKTKKKKEWEKDTRLVDRRFLLLFYFQLDFSTIFKIGNFDEYHGKWENFYDILKSRKRGYSSRWQKDGIYREHKRRTMIDRAGHVIAL